MDEQRQRIEELHRRRRDIVAQALKAYLSAPRISGLWASFGAQPVTRSWVRRAAGNVVPIPGLGDD